MSWSADFLIEKRKEKWVNLHSIEDDKRFRGAVARALTEDTELLQEVRRYPEKLIELVFVVVDKNKKTMPFFLNDVQHEFVNILNQAIDDFREGKIAEISLLVLKGRQQGFTTLITAYQLACSILNRNFEGFTLADNSANAESIFQNKAKFTYTQLPERLKPTEKLNNRKMLMFHKINSSWAVAPATKDVGRSRTVNFFHGSECAFWQFGIAFIQAALGEALTADCIKIYESTANGFNDYKAMWDSGAHVNCFFAWWRTKEYRIKFHTQDAKDAFLEKIRKGDDWIWQRLRWLMDEKHLEPEQLYWYWNKFDKYIDKDKIKQEYPCSPQEAFLLSGKNVFDTEIIMRRLAQLQKPLMIGRFIYDYDGLRITNIRWIKDRSGYISIFQKPDSPEITKYCIGGDTAGEGSDYYTGHVLDARTGVQVAHLRQRFDPHEYTRQMFCLGVYYKTALIGIEANFDSYPIEELQRLGYPNQYVRITPDSYTGKPEKRFGFKTTSITRPTAISKLVEVVSEHCDTINDRDTLEELLTITRNEKGRIEAPEGGHDDEMMGLAIAHQVREQVSFPADVAEVQPNFRFAAEEKRQIQQDYGEEIVVI